MTRRDTRLVLLSSAQLMPSIESIMLLLSDENVRLVGIHIYTTKSEVMSRKPAMALKEFVEGLDPLLTRGANPTVHLDNAGGDITPQAVKLWAVKQLETFASDAWIVNMTGGVKLMQLGMPDLLLANPELRVLYSEIAQGWFEISFKDGEVVAISEPSYGPRATAWVDKLEIGRLALAQLGGTGSGVRVEAPNFAPLVPLVQLAELTRTIAANGWYYHRVMRQRNLRPEWEPSGVAFEHFVGTVVHYLGAGQVVVSIEAVRAGNKLMERDVVCLHNGKLWFVDCKLTKDTDPKAEKPTHQLRETLEAVQELAGLSASIIILRPNWTQNRVELVRQATAFGRRGSVEVWGQLECAALVSRLHKWLNLISPIPSELIEIDQFLAQDHANHGYTLCDQTLMPRDALPKDAAGFWLLTNAARTKAEHECRNWVLVEFFGSWCIVVFNQPPPFGTLLQKLQDCLEAVGAPPIRGVCKQADAVVIALADTTAPGSKNFAADFARNVDWFEWDSAVDLYGRI